MGLTTRDEFELWAGQGQQAFPGTNQRSRVEQIFDRGTSMSCGTCQWWHDSSMYNRHIIPLHLPHRIVYNPCLQSAQQPSVIRAVSVSDDQELIHWVSVIADIWGVRLEKVAHLGETCICCSATVFARSFDCISKCCIWEVDAAALSSRWYCISSASANLTVI